MNDTRPIEKALAYGGVDIPTIVQKVIEHPNNGLQVSYSDAHKYGLDELDIFESRNSQFSPRFKRDVAGTADTFANTARVHYGKGMYDDSKLEFVTSAVLHFMIDQHSRFSAAVVGAAFSDWLKTDNTDYANQALGSIDVVVGLNLAKKYAGKGTGKKRGAYHTPHQNIATAVGLLKTRAEVYRVIGEVDKLSADVEHAERLMRQHEINPRKVQRIEPELEALLIPFEL